MDAMGQAVDCAVGIHCHNYLLNEVGGMGTTDVASHNLTRLGIYNHLDQAIGLGHRHGLAVAAEEGFLYHHVHATFSALLLGQAHHRQLGHGEHCAGHDVKTHIALFAQNGSQGALAGAVAPAAFKGTFVFVAAMVAGVALMDFSLAKIARRRGAALAATLFIVSFVFAPGMGFLSSKDFANPAMNWIAEGVNVCGQAIFLVASIILARKGAAKA